MWASNGRRAELVIESRDGSAVSEEIKSFLAAASVPLFLQQEFSHVQMNFQGKTVGVIFHPYLFIIVKFIFGCVAQVFSGRPDMKCFLFWLIACNSCSVSVTNSNAWDDEILIKRWWKYEMRLLFTCSVTSWLVRLSGLQTYRARLRESDGENLMLSLPKWINSESCGHENI